MSKELKNSNDDFVFGDVAPKKDLAVKGEKDLASKSSDTEDKDISLKEAVDEENAISEEKAFAKSRKLEKGTAAYEVFDWIRTICIGILAGIFIVVFLVQRDNVYGDSMFPTLSSGDVIFTQKISTYFKSFKRGDIVVLDGKNMDGYNSKEYLIKRIVGLPGETIRIDEGNVYIKAKDSEEFFLLQENYLPTGIKTTMMDDGLKKGYNEVVLGDDEYFCLGDNRPVSNDSRNLGPFTVNRIKAVAIIRVYPFNEIKIL